MTQYCFILFVNAGFLEKEHVQSIQLLSYLHMLKTRGIKRAVMLEVLYAFVIVLLCPINSKQCEAYSSLVQKNDLIRSIKPNPFNTHTHGYEQAMKTIFAILHPKQYATN